MSVFVRWSIISITLLLTVDADAQEVGDQEPVPPASRMEYLLNRADLVSIEMDGGDANAATIKRADAPILKYQNPLYEAQSDGVLVVWIADEVPVAFGSYSIRHDKRVFRELATCSDLPLRCLLANKLVWAPESQFARRPLDPSIAVPQDPRVRLRIMKRQAVRFTNGNQRVLPTPLYRYSSESQGIVDGAVFALSDTNDPEVLILIEAARSETQQTAAWRYTLARMNSQPRQVRLDGDLVWELQGYWKNPKSVHDPYVESIDSELPAPLRLSSSKR